MAFSMFSGSSSSVSMRIYILALITLVLVCSFSYCSGSSDSSSIDIGDNDDRNINDKTNRYYRLPFRSSPSAIDYINTDAHPILSRHRLRNILLRPALIQEDAQRHRRYPLYAYNKRQYPQSFHAMRG